MGVDPTIRDAIARAFRPEPVYGALQPAQLAVNLIAAQLLTNVFVPAYMALSFYGQPTADHARPPRSRFANATLYERWHEMRHAHLSFVKHTTAPPAQGGGTRRALASPDPVLLVAAAFRRAMPAEQRALKLAALARSPPPAGFTLVVRPPALVGDVLPPSYTTERRRLHMAAVFGQGPAKADIDELALLQQLYMRTHYGGARTDDPFALLWLLMVQLVLLYKGVRLGGEWQQKVARDVATIERSWEMESVPTARLPPRLSELVRSAGGASGAAPTGAVAARGPALQDALRANLELERAVRRYDVLMRYSNALCYEPPVHYNDVAADLYMRALAGTIEQVEDVREGAKGVTIETVGRGAVVEDPNEVARAEHLQAERENSARERDMRASAVRRATAAAETARHERMQACAAVASLARRHFDQIDRRSARVAAPRDGQAADLEHARGAMIRAQRLLPADNWRHKRSKDAEADRVAHEEEWKRADAKARADQAARKQSALAQRPAASKEHYIRAMQTYGDDNTSACEDCDYMPATMASLVVRHATASKVTTGLPRESVDLFRALYAVVRCVQQHGMDLDEAYECFSEDALSRAVCKCAFDALSGDSTAHDDHGRLEYLSWEACEAYADCLAKHKLADEVRTVLSAVTPSEATWMPKGHWLAKSMLLGVPPDEALAQQCRGHGGTRRPSSSSSHNPASTTSCMHCIGVATRPSYTACAVRRYACRRLCCRASTTSTRTRCFVLCTARAARVRLTSTMSGLPC